MRGVTMSQPIASTATRPPAFRDRERDDTHPTDRDRPPSPTWLWTVIEALAYAGAVIDPTGILAVERMRRAREEQEALDGRR
jgi:hypothetical protein